MAVVSLEGELGGKLNAARAASTEKRVADTDVAGSRKSVVARHRARCCAIPLTPGSAMKLGNSGLAKLG